MSTGVGWTQRVSCWTICLDMEAGDQLHLSLVSCKRWYLWDDDGFDECLISSFRGTTDIRCFLLQRQNPVVAAATKRYFLKTKDSESNCLRSWLRSYRRSYWSYIQ